MKILILCSGNSCRSQMAQGFMQSFDCRMEVHSAGTIPAEAVNVRAVQVMSEEGIDISSEKPKSVNIFLKDTWDYVITVCDDARESCPVFPGDVRHRLHIPFDDPATAGGSNENIMREFRRVKDQIKKKFYELYISEIKPYLS